jgi:putative transposase
MPRPLRVLVPGGTYHLLSRGNARQPIFRDDEDRLAFIRTTLQVRSRFGWRVLTYCLMGNHYHLVVRTPAPTLSRAVRQLNGVHAQRFNRRHGRVGHVFGGRFKAILVETDRHLLELARYVALTP